VESTVKLLMVAIYLAALLGIGVVASRRVKDLRDFFAAGKGLSFWAVAFSARATGESAWLLLGLTGMGAAVGVKAMWVVLGEILGVGLAWLWMARRFKRLTDRYDSVTIPDYLQSRFGDTTNRLRLVSAFALVVFVTIYVSAQIDATGSAFETFLGWNYYVGALVGFAVVLAYSAAGGFIAVAWSDVLQGALMFIGLIILPIAGLVAAGGIAPVSAGLQAIDPSLLAWSGSGGWTLLNAVGVVGLVLIGFGFLGSPQIFVRFIALRSETEIGKGAAVAIVWTVLADTGAVVTGLVGRHLLTKPGQDVASVLGNGAQDVLPLMTEALFPLVIVGAYVAIVLSAIMSTIDSLLVVAGSALTRDWYQKVRNPTMSDEALMGASRNATVFLALVALVLAMTVAVTTPDRTIFWFVIFGWSAGFLAVPFFKFIAPELPSVGPLFDALSELPPALLVSFAAGWLGSVTDPQRVAARAAMDADLKAIGD
jgi:sodium/proline symporter